METPPPPPNMNGGSLLDWALGIVSVIFTTGFIVAFTRAGKVERELRLQDKEAERALQKAIIDGREAREKQRLELEKKIADFAAEAADARLRIYQELSNLNARLADSAINAERRFATKDDVAEIKRGQKEVKEEINDHVEALLDRFQESIEISIKSVVANRGPIKNGN